MISYDFETTTYGKWILAGEHAVLRGHPALVFPILGKQLTLKYQRNHSPFSIRYLGHSNTTIETAFQKVIQRGYELVGSNVALLQGHFNLESTIPVGSGMGASAALCMAVARWFAYMDLLPNQHDLLVFARELEHLFHGQSSGLDISGVASNSGMYFQQGNATPIEQNWNPIWFLSHCGEAGMTLPCINQVQRIWENTPDNAQAIDQQMHQAVLDANHAIQDTTNGFSKLVNALNQAKNCFQQWGLINDALRLHMNTLRQAGAMAVKPTGSGLGGYVISLWEKMPEDLGLELIRV